MPIVVQLQELPGKIFVRLSNAVVASVEVHQHSVIEAQLERQLLDIAQRILAEQIELIVHCRGIVDARLHGSEVRMKEINHALLQRER